MSEYNFQEINFSEPEAISENRWLWIWNADKIPPHIGVSDNEYYFSLTFKDCEINLSASKKLIQAKRAKTPLVILRLSNELNFKDFESVFSTYTSAIKDNMTCLKPVLEVLSASEEIKQLSGLLKLLESRGNIKEVFALNLGPDYKGIPAYSVDDIVKRIEQLHETDRRKYKA